MKTNALFPTNRHHAFVMILAALGILNSFESVTQADETCSSPYLARIEGQEEFVYVWTLGAEGLGDGAR